MTLRSLFKKRNLVAALVGLFLILVLVQQLFGVFRSPEAPMSIGTILLPGDNEVIQTFTMPVYGSFSVALLAVEDGSKATIPGTTFDSSNCTDAEKRPSIDRTKYSTNSPEMGEYYKELSAYNSRQQKCLLDDQYGVIKVELINDDIVDTRLSSNMYYVPTMPGNGKVIADFRPFVKGVELRITVRSTLSDLHINRERKPYKVMVHPNQLN